MQPFQTIGAGTIPIVLHLPHNATHIPKDFDWNLDQATLEQEIHRLVDHHTLELFGPIIDAGAIALHNNLCRLYFDPERFADREKETMNQVGMGVFYTHTTEGERFREDDSDDDFEHKLHQFYHPYHERFTAIIEEMMEKFGRVLIIDGHSYPRHALPYEQFPDSQRPQIDIGTWTSSDNHTKQSLIDHTIQCFKSTGYSLDLNSPFQGSIIPTQFIGDPRVQTMMLEIRRDVYLCSDLYERGEVQLEQSRLNHFHGVLEVWLSWEELEDKPMKS